MAAKKTANKHTPAVGTPTRLARRGGASARSAAGASLPASADGGPAVELEAKHKLVRDSFTIPKDEYLVLAGLKERATQLRRPTKKSELLRAGVAALHAMSDRAFLATLAKVPSLKTGRPKDNGAVKPSG